MKKFRIIYLIYLIVITAFNFVAAEKSKTGTAGVKVYFADKQMMRLVPVEYYIPRTNIEKMCKKILDELTIERAYDSNIRTILPPDSVTVNIIDNRAVVNIQTEYFSDYEKVKPMENLIIFQLVNSFCSVEGVSGVEFTIDGERKKSFFGFNDMREVFVSQFL